MYEHVRTAPDTYSCHCPHSWLLGLPSPSSSTGGPLPLPASSSAAGSSVDATLVVRAQATDNAAVLVVMAAQQSARQRYWEALYCLDRAVQLDPNNTRWVYLSSNV